MDFYLSSYRLGKKTKALKKMIPKNKKMAYISNALDYSKDYERRKKRENTHIRQLKKIGFDAEILDLREYFVKKNALKKRIKKYGAIWVGGGNTFVLRQAMKLSGFDKIFKKLLKNKNIFYGGSSAGICILAKNMKGVDFVDNPKAKPYGKKIKTIWEGLGVLDYLPVPHYNSNHKESKAIDKVVKYCIKNKILFRALCDGEVIIIKNGKESEN